MFDLISIGAIKLDTFIILHEASVLCELKMPECKLCIAYGQKIPVEAFSTEIAGSAPNVAVGLARMKFKTSLLSMVGSDEMMAQARAFFKKNKVNASLVEIVPETRNSAAVVLSYKGESTQLVDHVPHVYHLPHNLPDTKMLHISELGQGYESLYREALRLAVKGVGISLNPGSIQIKEAKDELFELIAASTVLFLNMIEARRIIGKEDVEIHGIMASLKALGPKYVVVTDGLQGAYAFDGKTLSVIPSFPAERIEATGAGDAFVSGFLGAILKGKPAEEALRWASVNSASVITHIGPTKGLLSLREIQERLKERPSFQAKSI